MKPGHAVRLVVDSGAFTAWRRRESIDLPAYTQFCLRHGEYIDHAVNLDKIPAEWGRVPSPAEVEESASVGWKNLQFMRKEGVEAMPVFHMGERFYWLDKLIGEGFNYIGISPANDRSNDQKIEWLDQVFTHLCGKAGYPAIKTHAFGVTALPLLYRYPWFSADSITWLLVGGYGGIFVPRCTETGEFNWTVAPITIIVSDLRKKLKLSDQERQYRMLGESKRAVVDRYLSEIGMTIEEVRSDYIARMAANVRFFQLAARAFKVKPFRGNPFGFFQDRGSKVWPGRSKPVSEFVRIILTMNMAVGTNRPLTEAKYPDRLISYYYIENHGAFDLPTFVRTGDMALSNLRTKRGAPARKRLVEEEEE